MNALEFSNQNVEESIQIFRKFLEQHHRSDIIRILLHDDPSEHFSVVVNTLELIEMTDNRVSHLLLAEPNRMLPLFDQALSNALNVILQQHNNRHLMVFKPKLHVRLSNLPICPELRRNTLPKSPDIGHFLAITGQ